MTKHKFLASLANGTYTLFFDMAFGEEADGWNDFIINSDSLLRKDPFFYSVTSGNIDYNYIECIVE